MTIKRIVAATVLGLTALTAGVSFAGERGDKASFHRISGETGPVFLKALIRLNLSDEQKHEIAGILKAERNGIRTDVNALIDAREALFKATRAEPIDGNAVRSAGRNLAASEEKLALRRAEIAGEIGTVLTPDQKRILNELRREAAVKIREKISGLESLLDLWIARNS